MNNFTIPSDIKATPTQARNLERLDKALDNSATEYRKIKFHQFDDKELMISLFPKKWYDSLKTVTLGIRGKVDVAVHYNSIDKEKHYKILEVL